MRKVKYLLLIFIFSGVYSCDIEKYTTADLGQTTIKDSTVVYGQIRDNHFNFPLPEALVRLGNSRATTNAQGRYTLHIPFLDDYRRNFQPLIIISHTGYETFIHPTSVFPEPFSISAQLVAMKPFIVSLLRYENNTQGETVFAVNVLDYQGVDDIASVILRYSSQNTGNVVYYVFEERVPLSENEAVFRSGLWETQDADRRKTMLVIATDYEGYADTLVVPPNSM